MLGLWQWFKGRERADAKPIADDQGNAPVAPRKANLAAPRPLLIAQKTIGRRTATAPIRLIITCRAPAIRIGQTRRSCMASRCPSCANPLAPFALRRAATAATEHSATAARPASHPPRRPRACRPIP